MLDQYKLHQTQEDLTAQLDILKAYKTARGFTSGTSLTGPTDSYDGEMWTEDKLVEVIAVKNRKAVLDEEHRFMILPTSSFKPNDLSIDCYAIDKLRDEGKRQKAKAVVVARFTAGQIARLDVSREDFVTTTGVGYMKRGDRDERADKVYRLLLKDFSIVARAA